MVALSLLGEIIARQGGTVGVKLMLNYINITWRQWRAAAAAQRNWRYSWSANVDSADPELSSRINELILVYLICAKRHPCALMTACSLNLKSGWSTVSVLKICDASYLAPAHSWNLISCFFLSPVVKTHLQQVRSCYTAAVIKSQVIKLKKCAVIISVCRCSAHFIVLSLRLVAVSLIHRILILVDFHSHWPEWQVTSGSCAGADPSRLATRGMCLLWLHLTTVRLSHCQ